MVVFAVFAMALANGALINRVQTLMMLAKIASKCYKGVEAEIGGIARFGGVAVSLGVQTNRFKTVEGNFGIGIMF